MKVIVSTQPELDKLGKKTGRYVCAVTYPHYSKPSMITVSEGVFRQETDMEFITRLIGTPLRTMIEQFLPNDGVVDAADIVAQFPEDVLAKRGKIEVSPAIYRDETESEMLQRAISILPDDAQHVTVIEDTDLPYNGYRKETNTRSIAMRGSWVNPPDNTSPPIVDMVKARQAKMDMEWRPRRNKLLAELDLSYQRADESNDGARKALIAADKRKLRDMPTDYQAAVDAITDPVELDNFDPVIDIITGMKSI